MCMDYKVTIRREKKTKTKSTPTYVATLWLIENLREDLRVERPKLSVEGLTRDSTLMTLYEKMLDLDIQPISPGCPAKPLPV